MDVLPDDVLLEIFDFHLKRTEDMDAWHTLIHVCRRWRHLVLSSSRRLNLRIFCTDKRPVQKMLDIWPPFPLVVWNSLGVLVHEDDIIAALEHPDRVCEIGFDISSETLESLSVAMEVPFPELKTLEIKLDDRLGRELFLPDTFLGGFTPRLRSLDLDGIPFSTVHKLLSSASDLVRLSIWDVPIYEYVSPEEIATCLSSMTRLESMYIGFRHPRHYRHPEGRHPSPRPRTVLPALTYFGFKCPQGAVGYLEDLMACLDAPLLGDVDIINTYSPFDAEEIDWLIQFQ